jgi:hypothetical protein
MANIIEQYWTAVTQRLQVEADVFNSLVRHNAEMGRANELSLMNVLSSMLPSTLGVGTGVIFDHDGNRSSQTDIILFDRAKHPQILAQTTQLLFPIETVVMALEVKTTLTTVLVEEFAEKKRGFNLLKDSRSGVQKATYGIFGFDCSGAVASIAKTVWEQVETERPDITCVINPAIIGSVASTVPYVPELVPLHETNSTTGEKVPGSWRKIIKPTEPYLEEDRSIYPITALKSYGKTYYAGEPGRALLLFCDLLLADLAGRGYMDHHWLANYLPDVAKETQAFEYPIT